MPVTIDSPATSAEHGSPHAPKAANTASLALADDTTPRIVDVRQSLVEANLKHDIVSMLNPAKGPRKLPTLLLYNDEGLQLFEDVCWSKMPHRSSVIRANRMQITYLEEYYLTSYEIEVLQQSAAAIAAKIPSDSVVMELGSGSVCPEFTQTRES
jgi:uncharacterized SAM-dependent methyltransferase